METNNKNQNITQITSDRETEQDINITLEEIIAEEISKEISKDKKGTTDEQIRSSLNIINPDEGSMDSRG